MAAIGQPFTLNSEALAPNEPLPIDTSVVPTFVPAPAAPATETLILFNQSRLNQFYTGTDTVVSADLINWLNTLAADANVNGEVINLDSYPEIVVVGTRLKTRV